MNVLVVSSGGREHALAWRLADSNSVSQVFVAPGNAGIARDSRLQCVPEPVNPELLRVHDIHLVIVGPEAQLVAGLSDELRAAGVDVVGPSAAAAQLEGSKAFAKQFMDDNGISTAEHRVCRTVQEARAAVAHFGAPVVIKADGLAAGKGVSVCDSETQAQAAIETIMRERLFGDAGETVVVERRLAGFEASVIVAVDESSHITFPTAQDHKQIGEGGVGANTGGMGAVAPNPSITPEMWRRIEAEIVQPSVVALQRADWIFRGFLFIGLMIDEGVPRVLEYNVRFGDPEAQAILPLIAGDFGLLMQGLARGRLADAVGESEFSVRPGASCTVVAAAGGYPGPYSKGTKIELTSLPESSDLTGATEIFYAGVAAAAGDGAELVTAGGRVLAAGGIGDTVEQARRRAYGRLQLVHFDGMRYRADIGGAPVLSSVIEESDVVMLQTRKRGGLVPVVVQEAATGEVLMVGYADDRALRETQRSGYATFWSTSRSTLWTKGETSGNRLRVEEIRVDCDQDAILYSVTLEGSGVCHTRTADGASRHRCFYRRLEDDGTLANDEL
jgi:phosphoribosylamine--glycine ligase